MARNSNFGMYDLRRPETINITVEINGLGFNVTKRVELNPLDFNGLKLGLDVCSDPWSAAVSGREAVLDLSPQYFDIKKVRKEFAIRIASEIVKAIESQDKENGYDKE